MSIEYIEFGGRKKVVMVFGKHITCQPYRGQNTLGLTCVCHTVDVGRQVVEVPESWLIDMVFQTSGRFISIHHSYLASDTLFVLSLRLLLENPQAFDLNSRLLLFELVTRRMSLCVDVDVSVAALDFVVAQKVAAVVLVVLSSS